MKQFYKALGAMILTVIVLFWCLRLITRHGREITVPKLTNVSLDEARQIARHSHLKLVIADSVYLTKMPRGFVFKQNPEEGGKVKKGRRIMLTINSLMPRIVRVPNLIGVSLRQAESNIAMAGLKVGKLIYTEDIATNNVLGQNINGRAAIPGSEVVAETEVDIILGLNPNDCYTYVPNLLGVAYSHVKSELTYNSLNLKKCIFDKSVKSYADTLQAVVYQQSPMPSYSSAVQMGTPVTLYFTMDKSRIIPITDGI